MASSSSRRSARSKKDKLDPCTLYPCTLCPNSGDYLKVRNKPPVFDNQTSLRNHCRLTHDPVKCPTCAQKFIGHAKLNAHQKSCTKSSVATSSSEGDDGDSEGDCDSAGDDGEETDGDEEEFAEISDKDKGAKFAQVSDKGAKFTKISEKCAKFAQITCGRRKEMVEEVVQITSSSSEDEETTTTTKDNNHDKLDKNTIIPPPSPPPVPKPDSDSSNDVQIISDNGDDEDEEDYYSSLPFLPLFPMVELNYGHEDDDDGNNHDDYGDIEDIEEEDTINPSNPWMGHQMVEEDEDRKRLADDWDVGDLIPPKKRRPSEDSDASFELSSNAEGDDSDQESSDSGEDVAEKNKKNPPQPKVRVHLPLIIPPTLPKSPPWVSLIRMKPCPELILAQKRINFQYLPSLPSNNRPMIRGPYKKTLDKSRSTTCPQCGILVRDKYKLNRHLEKIHKKVGSESEPVIQCPYCPTSWRKPLHLKKHIRALHPERKEHPANNGRVKVAPCPHCGERFLTKYKLKKHIKLDHPANNGISVALTSTSISTSTSLCPQCGETFPTEKELDKHIESSHGGLEKEKKIEVEFKCSHCSLVSKHESNFIRHLQKHAREGLKSEFKGSWIG